MSQTPRSPVSPLTPTTPHSSIPQNNTTQTIAPQRARSLTWSPFTFRWYFLLVPTITSLIFGILTLVLVFYSQNHHGIGANNGSSAILFGWRFTPTLLAVLYTQLTVILFEDAKRTEPFARLAKAPADGASACGTVLQIPRAWWSIFSDVLFKRKSVGKSSWCLIFSALVNVLALLAISPLSSALLTSEEVTISRATNFNRIIPKDGTQLPLIPNRETYFHILAALMRNISTSAWSTDSSMTLPFWPSSEEMQIGSKFSSPAGIWTAATTTLYAGFDCKNMTLESALMAPKKYSGAYAVGGKGPYNGTQPMVTFVLVSDDKCRYEFSLHPSIELAYNGGMSWSSTSTLGLIQSADMFVNNIPFVANVTSTSPYARLNSSKECRDRDIIILAKPWTKPYFLPINGPSTPGNLTYERSPDFKMKGFLCESRYTMKKQLVTSTISTANQTSIRFPSSKDDERENASLSLIDTPSFQATAFKTDWKQFFNQEVMQNDAIDGISVEPRSQAKPNRQMPVPSFSGMGTLLAALYSFNVSAMLEDPHLVEKAARTKGRFFTECLRDAVTGSETVRLDKLSGEVSATEERVVVLYEIGITLAVLFILSFLLLALVYWTSRLSCRPLNLPTDPSSTVGLSMLLDPQLVKTSIFRDHHQTPVTQFRSMVRNKNFDTQNGILEESNSLNQSPIAATNAQQDSRLKWQPLVIRLRMLFALGLLLALVLVGVLTLNAFSDRSRLSGVAFIYLADVSKLGLSFSTFAPISIAPTLVSIIVSLWWDQLDMTFRILQPYISMSHGPTAIARGAGLTYRSKTWIGAAVKAARNKHFILFFIAMGSVLCQLLTVSMSALFERRIDNVIDRIRLDRTLDIRQGPVVTQIAALNSSLNAGDFWQPFSVLDELYRDPPKNWLAGAAIQLSLNGSKLPWTFDEWSFVPFDITNVSGPTSNNAQGTVNPSTNVTMKTSGIRARIECSPVDEVANRSSWITRPDEEDWGTNATNFYWLNNTMFQNTPSNTSIFATTNQIRCCVNGTNKDPQKAVLGYWSPTDAQHFPHLKRKWPIPFVTKFFAGKPIKLYDEKYDYKRNNILLFKDPPSLQAARCLPVIEVAEAIISVDKATGAVLSHNPHGPVQSVSDAAWSEKFILHDFSNSNEHYEVDYTGPLNVSASFGVLFMNSMFRAADPNFGEIRASTLESVYDNAFVMRDQEHGLNMDLMTYSMYALAKKDSEALLDYKTLVSHANRTFQTFFQHFVSNGLSLTEGGLAFQKLGDRTYEDLGRAIDYNGTELPARQYPIPNADRVIEASVSYRVQVLHMNTVATYLSTAILIWLIGTTAVMACLQRKYTSSLIRDVQLISDVLILVAGSDNFLKLIDKHGLSLKKNEDIKTMLGWFQGADGQVRWGVEVVGGRDAVPWVDAPKQGWHVRQKNWLSRRLPRWRKP